MEIKRIEDCIVAIDCLNQAFSLPNESVDLKGYVGSRMDQYLYIGAYDQDVLMGALAYDEDHGRIVLVGVLEKYRNKGVCKTLVQYVIDQAIEENLARICIEVIHTQVEYFETLGFEAVSHFNSEDVKVEMEYLIACKYLGRSVHVTIDKPYGSIHEYRPDVLYSCNVGYVDEIMKEEGDFVEAYIYNKQEPLETYQGIVMAVVFNKDSELCKLVVSNEAPIQEEVLLKDIGPLEQDQNIRIVYMRNDKN